MNEVLKKLNKDILNEDLTGKERKLLWKKAYLSLGLTVKGNKRGEAADWLGYSVRSLRNYLNIDFPELNDEFPINYDTTKKFFMNFQNEDYYWLGTRKEKLKKMQKKAMEALEHAKKSNPKEE